ncbi:MAG TPA: FHA domain-containing protein [Thermoanaerobaculia bacterium]|nr:FHA domain-containing protein [Thermoanaerobaculia bacterium]
MPFLIQRAAGRNLTLTQIHGSILRIGRGTNQELRSENPAVALEHAVIDTDAAGYAITDKGSITGTYVNRKPVETARLAKGDVIEIGDLRLEVQIADLTKPLFLRVVTARPVGVGFEEEEEPRGALATPGAGVVRAKKIDYVGAYRLTRPWLTKVSLTAILLIVALAVIGELVRPEKQAVFMPGGLSSAHARAPARQGGFVADRCDACHTPWKSVDSGKCAGCHSQPPHAQHASDEPDCFACHQEHRGAAKLATLAEPACVRCHSDLAPHMRGTPAQLISLRFADGRYPFEAMARIREFGDSHPEFVYLPDRNTLRFDHRFHLAPNGVRNGEGKRQVLTCTDCHALGTTERNTEPVLLKYDQHCRSCHRLTFDSRFPNAEVPHGGDTAIAMGFLINFYSGNRDLVNKPATEVRRILAQKRAPVGDDRAVDNARRVFRVYCRKCHEVQEKRSSPTVTPPVMRTVWLDRAMFTHGRHRTIGCEKCHAGARNSAATADLAMPRRENCTDCHASGKNVTASVSSCGTCHEYHLQPRTSPVVAASLAQAGVGGLGSGGRMLQGILLAVIVILLLVVLIPVGIALFQRLRPERAAPSPAAKARPPAIPQAPTAKIARPEVPTDRVARPAGEAPPDLPPQAPTPDVASTRVLVIESQPAGADAGAGTEMVQWNGMLHCTGGPLEGQRFIIEDDGFYIGRDPILSKIVIPDSRVSKRHLRIVPRDGKVWAIDEGSTNGTFMKGQRITEVQLKRGDTLVLGDDAATFVYQI